MAVTTSSPGQFVTKTKPLLKAQFTDLVAINFPVEERILQPFVPKGLELDYYNGETYVSLIAMMLKRIKIWGLPFSLVPASPELSLRFYVRRDVRGQLEKGACLIKDYVAGSTAAWFLESQFKTEFARMKIKCRSSGFSADTTPEVEYRWQVDDNWNNLRVRARSRIDSAADNKVGFILEHNHYFGTYAGATVAYRVERPQWEVWDAAQANFTCDVSQLFGKKFVKSLSKRPASVFVTGGSLVTVHKPVVIQ